MGIYLTVAGDFLFLTNHPENWAIIIVKPSRVARLNSSKSYRLKKKYIYIYLSIGILLKHIHRINK